MDSLERLKKVLTPAQMQLFELLGPPSIVVGEDVERYCRFVAAIFQSVQPKDIHDFIYQRDLIDLEWDVLRYRTAKAELINERAPFDFAGLFEDDDDANDGDDANEDDGAANANAARQVRIVAPMIPKLRQLDLMMESAEVRRDRAYRELERRRANLAKQLRDAVKQQSESEAANDETVQKAA
jgi:hypothetical protein